MLCNVCRNGLEGIWDSSKTKRVCSWEEWSRDEADAAESQEEAETVPLEDLEPQKCMFGHHVTEESFLQAIKDGCVIRNRFDYKGPRNLKIEQHGYYSLFSVKLQVNKAVMYMYVNNSEGGFSLFPSVADDEDLNSHISASTEDETTWSLIQEWLARCTEQHPACNARLDPTFVPNRLLELDTTGPEKTFRLVQSHNIRPGSRYITLSYCWGDSSGDNSLKLTQTTADTLFTEQPVHILPKTFRDAFAIIERLGINYLWIDRFCIFQDSLDDWRSESSAVCNIYSNGLLNVAALGAHNSDGGCFFSRDPACVQATVVQLCIEGPDKPQQYHFELEKGWVWRLSFNRDPLQERGWTIQERLLALRVLHFGSKQVFWECSEANCCELHPRSVDVLYQEDKGDELPPKTLGPRAPWKHLLDSPDHLVVEDPVRQLFTDWYGILMQYTECKLSFPSDKLVAISGVAKDMKERLAELGQDTDYLAGLWRCELPQSLVWNLTGPGTRPSAYRAPSWSWAAVDGPVNMAQWITNPDDILLSSLIAAETAPLGGDEMGQVLTGTVTLQGPLVTVKLSRTVHPLFEHALEIERLEKSEFEETLTEPPEGTGWKRTVYFDTKDDIRSQAFCLPVKAGKWAEKWNISGLALAPVDGGRYVRIGHFSLIVETGIETKEVFRGLPTREIVII